MVVLHFKKSQGNEFLYETTTSISIDDLYVQLCESKYLPYFTLHAIVNNLRLKIDRAAMALEELASKGPLKCENLRGLDEKGYDGYVKSEDLTVIDGLKVMPPKVGTRFVGDDQHYRIGWVLEEEMTQKMLDQAMAMKRLIHVSSVAEKRFLTKEMLTEQLDLVRGLMMMAYPGFHGLG